jgi:hypothetical protein
MTDRKNLAYQIRREASELAKDRIHKAPYQPPHESNGDERRFGESSHYAMSFTKGLKHDDETGLVKRTADFRDFRDAINIGQIKPFTDNVSASLNTENRKWEAPTAGFVFDLQGPDAQSVTMPPAPALGSEELIYEMAEVYELALLRDEPLQDFASGTSNQKIIDACARLNALQKSSTASLTRPRKTNAKGKIDGQTLLRGSSPGVEVGPYLSQLMLMGNDIASGNSKAADGLIGYGAQTINQRVPVATRKNYLTDWSSWCAAQNGAHLRDNAKLFTNKPERFITTPRDLATYVHDDALYQAYLNACLILLGHKAPFDHNFDLLSGMGKAEGNNAGGFALFGGPHILSLVTEVATRALKAVRYQKFQIHLRLRPEALAGRIEKADELEKKYPGFGTLFSDMRSALQNNRSGKTSSVLDEISAINGGTLLLPMAFQEGSPMHPSYGAGHAAVAGACVTILKAFFDTSAVLVGHRKTKTTFENVAFRTPAKGDVPVQFSLNGADLKVVASDAPLTLEAELNKLAANISIGRNMAGVHYFTDYYDSLRMGEAIAIGILEEQALCYRKEPFVLSLPRFDMGYEMQIPNGQVGFA